MKKIGGMVIDEENYKAMLKQFNASVPNKPNNIKTKRNMTQINRNHKSHSDFERKAPAK
jgi:hypothetical protein